ncbi:MAG: FAD-binding oxidoreductase [Planctomycetes bacterium]|nr:FAD-binding oxidoreductase [Planctomycetota bacterium]
MKDSPDIEHGAHDGASGSVPLWQRTPGDRPLRDTVERTVDIAILGGGVAGTSCAYHAASRGVGCVLLEAGTIASRASGRNDGQILLGLGEHYNRLIGQWGARDAEALWRFIDDNHEGMLAVIEDQTLACSAIRNGGLRLAEAETEAAELRESAELLAGMGVPVRYLDAPEVAEALPLSRGFVGGLFLEREAIFDPFAFVRELAMRARDRGARVREACPVAKIEGEAGGFRIHCADGPCIDATVLVHATSALAPELDRSGFLGRTIFPFRGQILATHPLPDEVCRAMPPWAMSSNFCYEYFRMHADRLTLGGMRWAVPGEETGIVDDSTVHDGVTARLEAWLEAHFPAIARAGTAMSWTGIMAGTRDGLPLVGGIPGRPGEYTCAAFNGYGMSFAFAAGATIVDLIESGRTERPAAAMFRPSRFV